MSQNKPTAKRWYHRIEDSLALAAMFLLVLLPIMEVVARKFFHTSVSHASTYMHHLVLVITFIGGIITSRENKHLSLSLSVPIKEPLKTRLYAISMLIAAMMTTAFTWSALSFVLTGFDPEMKVGVFPIQWIGMVMVVGYAIMAVRFVIRLEKKGRLRLMASSGFILGTFLGLEPIANILPLFFENPPGFIESLLQFSYSAYSLIAFPVIIALLIAPLFGMPLFVALGGVAYMLFARTGGNLAIISNESYEMLIGHAIPAIPLFTVAGFLFARSKAGERLVRFFKAFFSWFPGGLAIMAILACAFFTSFTGASGVTILALGAILSFVLVKGKYQKKFSTGLLTASGSVGLMFPPSLPIIIYGVVAGISIKSMFVGGIVPGFILVLAMVVFSVIYSVRHKTERQPFKIREAARALGDSLWEILLPLVIILIYFGGLATLEESAAIVVFYILIIETLIHRDLKIRELPGIVLNCIPIIGGVLMIIALAKGLSYFVVDADIPTLLTEWVQNTITSKYVFLLLLNLGLLITGMVMDIFSAILVVAPLIIPLGGIYGIHPVHLGIIFLANMELGYMTPPVGLNLFLASYSFDEPMGKLYKSVFPFFLIQLIAVLLITYIPVLTTGLLNLF
jgi:tripartite ATP-independent transporter DctM subunit